MELEFVKRELYNQINLSKSLEKEKRGLAKQVYDIEEEMQLTIQTYKEVLTASETDIDSEHGKAKIELVQMTKQIETLDSERQKLLAEKVVMNDEKKSLSKMLERSQNLQDQLSAQIEAMTQQVGVPKSEVDKLKELLTKREAEVVKMNLELQAVKNKMQDEQNDAFSQIQKITTELTQTRTYLQTKEEEVVMLRRDVNAFQQMEEQLKDKLVGEEVAIANKELEAQTAALKKELETAKDQNKTMILQRKSLVQTKEQIQKELEKLLTKTENLEQEKKTIQKDKIEEI